MKWVAVDNMAKVIIQHGAIASNEAEEDDIEEEVIAKQEVDKQLESSFQRGYEEGWQAAHQGLDPQMEELQKQAKELAEDIPTQLNDFLIDLEQQARVEVCNLSVRIAECLVNGCLPEEKVIKAALDEALQLMISYKGVEIHLHPQKVEMITDTNNLVPAGVTVIADGALQSHDVVVYTDQGKLDGTLDSRLKTLQEMLKTKLVNAEI